MKLGKGLRGGSAGHIILHQFVWQETLLIDAPECVGNNVMARNIRGIVLFIYIYTYISKITY